MELKQSTWNQKLYQEYIEYLKAVSDESYKIFCEKLTPTNHEILGIRIPLERKIAKEIKKGNYQEFLSLVEGKYYEELNIEGFILGEIKDFKELLYYLDSFVAKIDNWATCDTFCNSIKIVSQYPEEFLEIIEKYLQSEKEFTVRVGLVLLLSHYVKKEYIKTILFLVDNLTREEYYINMASAWLIAECYVKEREITESFLKQNHLNKFTQNKTISKICDSYRVSKEEKEALKKLRK